MDRKLIVKGIKIGVSSYKERDYICLTDMVKGQEGEDHIRNWMRNRNTIEFLGTWEILHNTKFKGVEFDTFLHEAGANRFNMTPRKWIESTDAIGIISIAGRNGGTYAHVDIAYHFGMWLSPEFHLLIVKEFQRLKEDESRRLNSDWQDKRFLAKAAYRLQTDAIKEYMLPALNLPKEKERFVYATEADIINVAVFGLTAKMWEEQNPDRFLKGENMRDSASVTQLVAVVAAESLNKELIKNGLSQNDRLKILRDSAMENIRTLSESPSVKKRLENKEKNIIDEELSEHNKALKTALNYNPNA